MKTEILGDNLPVLSITLDTNEVLFTEHNSSLVSLMSPEINKRTISTAKKLSPFFSQLLYGHTRILDQFIATTNDLKLAFSTPMPGRIVALKITQSTPLIIKKGSLIVMTSGLTITPRKKFNFIDALFGNDDLALQVIQGDGTIYLHLDTSAKTYTLSKVEEMTFDQAAIAYMDFGMKLYVKRTNIFKAFFFGGNDVLKYKAIGPGTMVIQNANVHR